MNFFNVAENFIKYKTVFVPFAEVIHKTLNFEVTKEKCSMVVCESCKTKLVDFYHFKLHSERVRMNYKEFSGAYHENLQELDHQTDDKTVYSTVQIVRNFIARHSLTEIKEHETEMKLVITSKPKIPPVTTSSPTTFQESISIKSEPMEIKLEPIEIQIKEDPDAEMPFLDFLRTFGDSSEELTNSSEGSMSRLPAFEESTYFDGDKFVLRSEVPPKKLKEPKKRQRKPELWATNVQKKLRNAGQRYRSAKGYIVEARSMAGPCSCRQECATKVNEKNRLMNFNHYWNLDEVCKKRHFISEHIKLERPMRAMKKARALSRLILHYLDVTNSDGSIEQIKVCKKMFLNTLDISNSVITTTVKLNNQQYFENSCRA